MTKTRNGSIPAILAACAAAAGCGSGALPPTPSSTLPPGAVAPQGGSPPTGSGNAGTAPRPGTPKSLQSVPRVPADQVLDIETPDEQETYYEVRRGDTLSAIARRYGTTVAALREANGLDGDLIQPGQLLLVPKGN